MRRGKQKERCRLPGTSLAVAEHYFQKVQSNPKKTGTPLTRAKLSLQNFWIPCRHREIRDEQDPKKTPPYERADIRKPETIAETPEEIGRDKQASSRGND